jgi:hypothetical protein
MSRDFFQFLCYMGAAECGLAYFIYRKKRDKVRKSHVCFKHIRYKSVGCDASPMHRRHILWQPCGRFCYLMRGFSIRYEPRNFSIFVLHEARWGADSASLRPATVNARPHGPRRGRDPCSDRTGLRPDTRRAAGALLPIPISLAVTPPILRCN